MPESTIAKAQSFAKDAHKGQVRKFQGTPYVWHPFAVSKLVEIYTGFDFEGSVDLRVAAMLHDVVEDTDVTLSEIEKEFGSDVADLVFELTSYRMDGEDKAEYLSQRMTNMSDEALLIKLCDRLDNLSDYKMVPKDFRDEYSEQTEQILSHLEKNRHLTSIHKQLVELVRKYARWAFLFDKEKDPS
jgi:GTP pyrophosphokinase